MPAIASPPAACAQLQRAEATTGTVSQGGGGPVTVSTWEVAAAGLPDSVSRFHEHPVGPNQCCSAVVQRVAAPVAAVWSVVRRFDKPQMYKHFVKSCQVIDGDGDVGTLREVHVISGLPAVTSTERLEILDDERHVLSFRVVGGEHRLANYRSVTTLHACEGASACEETVVVESYVVDVPPGNTEEDTRVFVDTIVRCNLQSLARIAEEIARRGSLSAGTGTASARGATSAAAVAVAGTAVRASS